MLESRSKAQKTRTRV